MQVNEPISLQEIRDRIIRLNELMQQPDLSSDQHNDMHQEREALLLRLQELESEALEMYATEE